MPTHSPSRLIAFRLSWTVGLAALGGVAVLVTLRGLAQSSLPVVPGAQGFGMTTRAAYACGASPAILRVTNLNDSGAGSLRAALSATVPRVVVFEISGTIVLSTDLVISDPCVTVAGQTAPSPGITLRGSGLNVYTHDVLLQHLRIRPGDGIRPTDCYQGRCGVAVPQTQGHDALLLYRFRPDLTVRDIVVDHVSLSWAAGKNSNNLTYNTNVTYWRCLISEALYRASSVIVSSGEPSSLGMLLGSETKGMSIIGNLFAHNSDRNPEIHENSTVQFVNNVIYDWGKDANEYRWATFMYAPGSGTVQADIIGNKYIAGPPPSPFTPLFAVGLWAADVGSRVYVDRNEIDETRQAVVEYENYMIFRNPRVNTPAVSPSGITVQSSTELESFVLANAGARPTDRDAVDARIVREVKDRSGTVIGSQNEVGGWPTLAVNVRHLFVPGDPHHIQRSGYTILEEWLHAYAALVEGVPQLAPANLDIVVDANAPAPIPN